jgi:CheY-like chemotaxis protein
MLVVNVDDDLDNGHIFKRVVMDINPAIHCIVLSSGFDLINFLTTEIMELPDFIFLDSNMPMMDGRECLVEIRKNKKLENIPVIIFSTYIAESDIPKYQQLNASCLEKPRDFHTLKATLDLILH